LEKMWTLAQLPMKPVLNADTIKLLIKCYKLVVQMKLLPVFSHVQNVSIHGELMTKRVFYERF